MPFEIPTDLHPDLMPLAWLIGRWEGNGHGAALDDEQFEYGQQIDFSTNGQGYLHYVSQLYRTDEQGQPTEPLTMETGFWRPGSDGEVEAVLSSPEGWSEVWVGKVDGAKVELVTDAVMRTASASIDYSGGHRLYGTVEGDLLWTFDRATTDTPLKPYLWARLQRR